MLFGTNYPMITAERALEHLDTLELDDGVQHLFLTDNARRVFKLQDKDPSA